MGKEIQKVKHNRSNQLELETIAFQFEENTSKEEEDEQHWKQSEKLQAENKWLQIIWQLKAKRKELERRQKVLKKREAQIENERKKLHSESVWQLKKGKLEKSIIELRGKVTKVKKKMEAFEKKLEKKEKEHEDLVELNRHLIFKERISTDELIEVRKELIHFLKDIPSGNFIGVKKMGELDSEPFHNAMKRKYSEEEEAEDKAVELHSLWEDSLRDHSWYPFKIVKVEGYIDQKEVVDEENEKLKDLKNEFGDEVYFAVRTALVEMKEYNPRGGDVVEELWNFREGKKATLKEGVSYVLKRWKLLMHKRN